MNETSTSTAATAESGTVRSADGTEIAWSRQGAGPAIVMVHCVATSRAATPQPTLPDAFAERFMVVTYDRRGTGESADGASPYAVRREIEDLEAVLSLVPPQPTVYGFSSGAVLALLAAEAGVPAGRLLLLEPPIEGEADPTGALAAEGRRRVAEDVREAGRWFDRDIVGVPEEILAQLPEPTAADLRNTRTIVHELEFLAGTPASRFASIAMPVDVVASEQTVPIMIEWCRGLAEALPNGRLHVVPGEWHGVPDETLVSIGVEAVARST